MKNVLSMIILPVLAIALISGCLDTKEAEPARVDHATLNELGWVHSGTVQKEKIQKEIGGVEVAINTAQMDYHDKVLADTIHRQLNDLGRSVSPENQGAFTSQFITMRLALPGGITLPNSILTGIIDTLIKDMANENGIQNFHEVEKETVKTRTGSLIRATSYEGYIRNDGDESLDISIQGIVASWSSEGTTIIAIGVIPAEEVVLEVPDQMGEVNDVTLDIDKDEEKQDILTLIQNVE